MEKRPELDMAFSTSKRVRSTATNIDYPLMQQRAGELVVASGKLIACHPFYETLAEPFEFTVAPGNYPVIVTVVPSFSYQRPEILYTRVQFALRQPVLWELALRNTEYDWGRFEVDLEAGCLMDAAAFPYLMQTWAVDGYEAIENELSDNRMDGQPWLEYLPHPRRNLNVFFLAAYFSETATDTYQGFDDDGNCVCLLTDYNSRSFSEIPAEK